MEIMDCLLTRRSVRQYDADKPVPAAVLEKILRAAMHAPSSKNSQPWEFVIVTEKALLQRLQDAHPYASFLTTAGTGIVVCADMTLAYKGYAPLDCALTCQNIMLAAHALGYGSCMCGVYPDEGRPEQFAAILKLPAPVVPIALMVVGTPAQKPAQPRRFDKNKIHINGF